MRQILARLSLAAAILGPFAPMAGVAQNSIKVGAAVSLSGDYAIYDKPPLEAARMAFNAINQNGGLLGKQIDFIVEDSETNRALSVRLAHDLVNQGVKMMIVACDYDEGAPAAEVAIKAGLIAFSLCASDPKMGPQGLGRLAFSAADGQGNFAYAMAEWLYKTKGWRKAYTLTDMSAEVHKASLAFFTLRWRQLPGTQTVGSDTFMQDDPSIAPQITKIKALGNNIDFIWLASHNPGFAGDVRQIRAAGITTPIIATDGPDGNYWISAVPHLSNMYYVAYCSVFGDDPRPAVRAWLAEYTRTYGERPEACFALAGDALVESWALAVQRAKTFDTAAVAAQLEKFHNEKLLAGLTSYTPEAHLQLDRPVVVMQIQDGKFSAIGTFRNTALPPLYYRSVQ